MKKEKISENKDYIQGYADGINDGLSYVGSSEHDIVGIRFPISMDPETIDNYMKILEEKFPDKTIVFIPSNIYLETWDKDVLDYYIKELIEIAKSMEDEKI